MASEKTQTLNLVSVANKDYKPGDMFTDAQGMSFVLAYEDVTPTPTKYGRPTAVPLPTAPTAVSDPCGIGNAMYVLPANTTYVTWSYDADHNAIATANPGYMFYVKDPVTNDYVLVTSYNFGKPVEENVSICKEVVQVPTAPKPVDPCNSYGIISNATYMPADTAQFDWSLSADGILSVTLLTPNSEFPDGSTTYVYGPATDDGKKCPTSARMSEALTCDSAKTGITNGAATVTITNTDDEYNAATTYTWKLMDGTTVVDSGTTESVVDGTSVIVMLHNIPAGTYDFVITGDNDSTVASTTVTIEQCPPEVVMPAAPMLKDYCYDDIDSIVVPTQTGIAYYLSDNLATDISGHTLPFTGNPISITAIALPGYSLTGQSIWEFDSTDFTNLQCVTVTKTGQSPTSTNGDGAIGIGDLITWTITVKNISTETIDMFDVALTDATATFVANDSTIYDLAPGKTVSLTATSIISSNDATACKATNTVLFDVLNISTPLDSQ